MIIASQTQIVKALVGAFNQEKALVGAFFVIVKTSCVTDGSFYSTTPNVLTLAAWSSHILHHNFTGWSLFMEIKQLMKSK